MPSARKRRLRSIIKGYLNRIGLDGSLVNATASAQISESQSLNELDEADLKAVLVIESLGTGAFPNKITYDADADDAFGTADFKPFDVREQVDTEGHGVGDSQLTANLYVEMLSLGAEISALQVTSEGLLTESDTQEAEVVDHAANGGDPDCTPFTSAISASTSITTAGLTAENGAIAKQAQVVSLETRIGTLANPYEPTTSMQVAGSDYNVEDIKNTDAATAKNSSEARRSAVVSAQTSIEVNQAAVDVLSTTQDPC